MKGYYLAGFCDGHFRYFAGVHDRPMQGAPRRPRVLSVDGFRVDEVTLAADVMRFEPADDETATSVIERTWSQLFAFPLTPRSGTRYRDGEPLDLAFCKAISAHPFGNMIYLAAQGSASGIDLELPRDFAEQFQAHAFDGGQAASKFLDDLASRRGVSDPSMTNEDEGAKFLVGLRVYANNRRIFMTRDGRLGLGPQMMQPGDEVIVLFGSRMPFVVRPRRGHHIFIGVCLIMDDEVMHGAYTARILPNKPGLAPPRMTFELR